jgi:hypothetical protein
LRHSATPRALLRISNLDGTLTVDEGIGGETCFFDTYMHFQMTAKPVSERFANCPWGLYHIEVI